MFLRFALAAMLAAAVLGAAERRPAWAEDPAPSPPAAPAKPDAAQGAAQANDPIGEETTQTAKPIVYLKGTGTWDNAFETITNSFKTLKTYITKEGLKIDGQSMTIFTATDDTGFQFQAAIPVAEAPKTPPKGEIAVGTRVTAAPAPISTRSCQS